MNKKTDSIVDEILQKGIPDPRDAMVEESMKALDHLAPPPPLPVNRELEDLAVDAINVVGLGLVPGGHQPSHVIDQELLPKVPPVLLSPEVEVLAGEEGEAVLDTVVRVVMAIASLATKEPR
ncbi:MAG: hypothetical protein FD153_35 [Rhodospirillaceae bacterium]|nr:MAG: hypothetical protein FD153_35 [Rhodospirillaceae bacterium]